MLWALVTSSHGTQGARCAMATGRTSEGVDGHQGNCPQFPSDSYLESLLYDRTLPETVSEGNPVRGVGMPVHGIWHQVREQHWTVAPD
jgi:hypothetical protein